MARNSLTPFGGYGDWDPFRSLHREMNRLFDEVQRGAATPFARGRAGQAAGDLLEARINVSETDQEFRVTAELPGVAEEDIDVTVDGDTLTIRGEKKFEQESGGEKENYHFVERSYGTFQRSLRLPYTLDPDQVRAQFRNGVLTLTAPKPAQQPGARRIQIGGDATHAQVEAQNPARDQEDQERGQGGDAGRERPSSGEQPRAH